MKEPFIVLDSALVELLTPTQLQFVLGHEVGHIASGHVLYRTLLALALEFGIPGVDNADLTTRLGNDQLHQLFGDGFIESSELVEIQD